MEVISDSCDALYLGQPRCSEVVARAARLGFVAAGMRRHMPLRGAPRFRRGRYTPLHTVTYRYLPLHTVTCRCIPLHNTVANRCIPGEHAPCQFPFRPLKALGRSAMACELELLFVQRAEASLRLGPPFWQVIVTTSLFISNQR